MARVKEEGSHHPPFLGPVGTALRGCSVPCRSREVSPPGQDQPLAPAGAGEMLVSLGRLLSTPGWG